MLKPKKKGQIYIDMKRRLSLIRNVFAELEYNESGVDLNDFLKFIAATNRIPIQGFGKLVEVFIVDTDRYPTASTCGLCITVPIKASVEKLLRILKDGGAFGNN